MTTRVGLDAAKTTLAAGGLLAAFGVTSCCALPIVLSVLGISAASLTTEPNPAIDVSLSGVRPPDGRDRLP